MTLTLTNIFVGTSLMVLTSCAIGLAVFESVLGLNIGGAFGIIGSVIWVINCGRSADKN